jgi:ribose-phosphate pyrophosphokinase
MIEINGVGVEVKNFPVGKFLESGRGEIYIERDQLAFTEMTSDNVVIWRWEGDHELLWLRFVKRYMDGLGVKSRLGITYMPYARMDRATNYLFTLPEVADVINELGFSEVAILEPHSDVTAALLKNSRAMSPTKTWLLEAAKDAIDFDVGYDFLAFPDAGAQKRYAELEGYNEIVGIKHRDSGDGHLGGYHLIGAEALENGSKVLICDDLCSYGGTFAAMSAAIKKVAPGAAIYLMVTHLEPSVYRGTMIDESPILKVFATNSLQSESEHAKVVLFDIASMKIINKEEQ